MLRFQRSGGSTVDRYSAADTRPRAASTAAIGSFIRRLNLIDVF